MSKLPFKFLKQLYLPGLGILCLVNALGVIYLYQATYLNWPRLQQSQQHQQQELKLLKDEQIALQKGLADAQEQIAKQPLPSNELQHVEWLVQQAYWQLNTLYQAKTAQQLLEFAYQFSEKNHWTSLEKTLLDDISLVQQTKLSSPDELMELITELSQELNKIQWDTPKFIQKTESRPAYFDIIKPFIHIEKIHAPIAKVLPPNEQHLIVQNLKTLLPQLQAAALSHQQDLFQKLSTQFSSQWNLIANEHPNASITQAIEFLIHAQWAFNQAIPLQSLELVHNLQQQINTRA